MEFGSLFLLGYYFWQSRSCIIISVVLSIRVFCEAERLADYHLLIVV